MSNEQQREIDRLTGIVETLVRRCDDLNSRLVEAEVTLRAMQRIAHPPAPANAVRKARHEPLDDETPNIAPAELWGNA